MREASRRVGKSGLGSEPGHEVPTRLALLATLPMKGRENLRHPRFQLVQPHPRIAVAGRPPVAPR